MIAASKLKSTRKLSCADAFVVTGDPEIAAVSDLVEVVWLGPPAQMAKN